MTELVEPETAAGPEAAYRGVPALALAGLVVAVAGGLLWAYGMKWTGSEWAMGAILLGGACGFAVGAASGGNVQGARPVAAVASLVGVGVGKYVGVHFLLADLLDGDVVGLGSARYFSFFMANLDLAFDLIDALFIALAVAAAWRFSGKVADGLRVNALLREA